MYYILFHVPGKCIYLLWQSLKAENVLTIVKQQRNKNSGDQNFLGILTQKHQLFDLIPWFQTEDKNFASQFLKLEHLPYAKSSVIKEA